MHVDELGGVVVLCCCVGNYGCCCAVVGGRFCAERCMMDVVGYVVVG